MVGPRTALAIASTASKSPWLAIGNPASITSTPRRASCSAISSFSPTSSEIPGDCSPSRRVVSKIFTWSVMAGSLSYPGSRQGFGQRKTSPALRHEEASASTGGCPQLRKEEALGAQFLRHEPTMLPDRGLQCQLDCPGSPTDAARESLREDDRCDTSSGSGSLAGAGYALVARRFDRGRAVHRLRLGAATVPVPAADPAAATPTSPWVEAAEDGACPAHHPVKAKLRAGSSTCPAAPTTTAPRPTAATSRPPRPRPTASAPASGSTPPGSPVGT